MGKLLEQYVYSDARSRSVMKIHEELISLLKAKEYDKVKKVLQAHIKESIPLFGQALHTPEEISRKKIKGGRRRAP